MTQTNAPPPADDRRSDEPAQPYEQIVQQMLDRLGDRQDFPAPVLDALGQVLRSARTPRPDEIIDAVRTGIGDDVANT